MSEFFFKLINKSTLLELGSNNYKEGSHEHFINDIKKKLQEINPTSVVVQGDTNTTLYGALAAKSLGIKISDPGRPSLSECKITFTIAVSEMASA